MKLKEFAEIINKRNKNCYTTSIMVVGEQGRGLDGLCVSLAKSINNINKKLQFKDKNFLFGSTKIGIQKDSIFILSRLFGRLEIHIYRDISRILQTYRMLKNIIIVRDMNGLSKSSLVRLFDYKISISSDGDLFIEHMASGKVVKLDFDLNKGKVGLFLQGYCPICEIKNCECVKLDRTIKDGN